MAIVTRTISMLNFIITSSALTFQVTVLYPWHKQLDDSFEALKKEHVSLLQKLDRFRAHEAKGIKDQVGNMMKEEM
ncbi:hypothetical protein MPDQ_003055 [Monascus purpureus]|uniref:Mitochondrial phosphate carrier protein n=1 Tax=Monascus purpureus TaxID=5098 RepID=A0A507R6A7_MONPU|nr:hypothetical protein MPDQ_003055 [Monascus purpureus]BDD59375.1 hypothetical protein MAP00_004584 [Monascus purpureus]